MQKYASEDLIKYIKRFNEKKIMVLGDVIADRFVIADPDRLSREAPVLILRHKKEKVLAGGGANAAANIASLGAEVDLLGIRGDDASGRALIKELQGKNIITEGIFVDGSRPTAEKTRILAGGEQIVRQQVVRVDKLESSAISSKLQSYLLKYFKENIKRADAVLFSDYGNGIFSKKLAAGLSMRQQLMKK